MNEINYEICLYISSVKLGLNVFEKTNSIKSIFFKEFDCKTILNKKEINFQEAENIIEKSIFEIEKLTGNFLNDIYLIVDTPDSLKFGISLLKTPKFIGKDLNFFVFTNLPLSEINLL